MQKNGVEIDLNFSIKKIVVENGKVKGIITKDDEFVASNCVVVSYPAYLAVNQLFDKEVFEKSFVDKVNRLNKTTSVVEVHFCLSKQIDKRQVVFPVGKDIAARQRGQRGPLLELFLGLNFFLAFLLEPDIYFCRGRR